MTDYALMKSQLDVLLVYEEEAEAVAWMLSKSQFTLDVQRWVWTGEGDSDSLLKQTEMFNPMQVGQGMEPNLDAPAAQAAMAEGQLAPTQWQMGTEPRGPWGMFGQRTVHSAFDPTTGEQSQPMTQQRMGQAVQGMQPDEPQRQAYEARFGEVKPGASRRLGSAYDAAMGAVTGAEDRVKDWWGRNKGAGHTGVRNTARNLWQGGRNVAADYLDASQGVKTPEEILERQNTRRQERLEAQITPLKERLAAMGGGQPPVEAGGEEAAPVDPAQTSLTDWESTDEQPVDPDDKYDHTPLSVSHQPLVTSTSDEPRLPELPQLRPPSTGEQPVDVSGPLEGPELITAVESAARRIATEEGPELPRLNLPQEEPQQQLTLPQQEGPGYAGFTEEQFESLPAGAQTRWKQVDPAQQQAVYDAMGRGAWDPERGGVKHWQTGSWKSGRRAMGIDKSQPFDAAWRMLRGA